MQTKTKKITVTAMLVALAFGAVAVGRVPLVLFLKYDPKDVIIALGGMLLGPATAVWVSCIVSVLEMVTISDTGVLGCLMNIIASCAFALPAAVLYQKNRTAAGAAIGLGSGCLLMTAVMLLWNYIVTPFYMGYPREAVAALLLPAFLPFNLVKGGLNAGLSVLIFKPVTAALKRAGIAADETEGIAASRFQPGFVIAGAFVVVTCTLLALVLKGVL